MHTTRRRTSRCFVPIGLVAALAGASAACLAEEDFAGPDEEILVPDNEIPRPHPFPALALRPSVRLDVGVGLSHETVRVMAQGQRPDHVALQEGFAYFTNAIDSELDSVVGVELASGRAYRVSGPDRVVPQVVADAAGVYYADATAGRVLAQAHGGSATQTLADGLGGVWHLAESGDSLLVATFDSGVIARVSKTGNGVDILAKGLGVPANLAVAGDRVYYVNLRDNSLYVLSIASGEVTRLTGPENVTAGLVVDAEHIFWTDDEARAVMRLDRAGGVPEVFVPHQYAPRGIAGDDMHVYWATQSDGRVSRTAKTGGAITVLAAGYTAPGALALSADALIFTEATKGALLLIDK
jgi:sugar lactone lactonase YvrE